MLEGAWKATKRFFTGAFCSVPRIIISSIAVYAGSSAAGHFFGKKYDILGADDKYNDPREMVVTVGKGLALGTVLSGVISAVSGEPCPANGESPQVTPPTGLPNNGQPRAL